MASTGDRITHGFYLGFGLLGMLGNGSVCYTIVKAKLYREKTNLLLLGLAVSDLISSTLMVFNVYLTTQLTVNVPEGPLGTFYCIFWNNHLLFWTSYQASCYMLISVTLERYLILTNLDRPQGLHRLTKRETVALLAFPWIIAFSFKGIFAFYARSVNGKCVSDWPPSPRVGQAYGYITFLLGYFIPLVVLIFAYMQIILVLKRQAEEFSNSTVSSVEAQLFRARKKIIRVLLMLATAFFVLLSPDQVAFFLWNIGAVELEYTGPLFQVSTLLLFLNSAINPIIYIFAYEKFRQAFTKVFLQPVLRSVGMSPPLTNTDTLVIYTKTKLAPGDKKLSTSNLDKTPDLSTTTQQEPPPPPSSKYETV